MRHASGKVPTVVATWLYCGTSQSRAAPLVDLVRHYSFLSLAGAPLIVHGQDWMVSTEHGRLVFQDDMGLLDLDMPRLLGVHQISNAGAAIAGLRALGFDDEACSAALRNAQWQGRLQRLQGWLPHGLRGRRGWGG